MKIIYEDYKIVVEENGSGEIIVTNKLSDFKHNYVRISPNSDGSIGVTAHNSVFKPTSFNGLGGFLVM
jgi:hypothetical protein